MTLPEEFKRRMAEILGNEAELLFKALEREEPVRAFRVNTNKIKVEDFLPICPFDAEKIPFCDDGFYTTEQNPGTYAAHAAGMVYMQDPAAMSSVRAVEVRKGWKILDACAAPGGKTAQLSAYTGEDGIVVANEYNAKRCRVLLENVERMGCRNVAVLNLDTKFLPDVYREYFDLAVVDAPCSGEGMFRKNSKAVEEWSTDNIFMCRDRQRYILENVAKCVRGGGILLYSTCTFSLEENEKNIQWFLDGHPEFEIIPAAEKVRKHTADGIDLPGCGYDMTLARRFYPHISPGEGQFFAVLRKKAETSEKSGEGNIQYIRKNKVSDKKASGQGNGKAEISGMLEAAKDFLNENTRLRASDLSGQELIFRGGNIYLSPEIPLPDFGVFVPGVCVGEVRKGRVIPHHGLFSAYGNLFDNRVDLKQQDLRVNEFMRGREILIEDKTLKGWGVLTVENCALGGIKASCGVCKNHYPKGLWLR